MLGYTLVKAGVQVTFTGTASGADHLINVSAATTAGWAVGRYQYQAAVTLGADRFTVGGGQIEVRPNFTAATAGLDARSHARKALEAIEAVIEGRASQAQQEYTIANRQLKFITLSELLAFRDRYRGEVLAEEAAANLGGRNKLLTRF